MTDMIEPAVLICARCGGDYLALPPDFTGDPTTLTHRLRDPCHCTRPERPGALRSRRRTPTTTPAMNVPMVDLVFGDDEETPP